MIIYFLILNMFFLNTSKITFLFPNSSYYEDEFGQDHFKKKYLGLFVYDNSVKVKNTFLTLSKGHEYCGEEDPDSKTVNAFQADSCLLLIADSNIKPHEFELVNINKGKFLKPNFMQNIVYGTNKYTVACDGLPGNFKSDPWLNAKNYTLKLKGIKNGVLISQTLVSVKQFNERYPSTIKIAGDIDGDGKLDILLEGGDHYAGSLYKLYLSSYAKSNELLGLAAEYQFTGC